jgi:hypothetical protein
VLYVHFLIVVVVVVVVVAAEESVGRLARQLVGRWLRLLVRWLVGRRFVG